MAVKHYGRVCETPCFPGEIHRKSPQIVNYNGDRKLLRRIFFCTAGPLGTALKFTKSCLGRFQGRSEACVHLHAKFGKVWRSLANPMQHIPEPPLTGDRKSLSIAKNHPQPSQNFSGQFGPSIHEMKGFSKNHPQKFTRTSPKTWEDKFLGIPFVASTSRASEKRLIR